MSIAPSHIDYTYSVLTAAKIGYQGDKKVELGDPVVLPGNVVTEFAVGYYKGSFGFTKDCVPIIAQPRVSLILGDVPAIQESGDLHLARVALQATTTDLSSSALEKSCSLRGRKFAITKHDQAVIVRVADSDSTYSFATPAYLSHREIVGQCVQSWSRLGLGQGRHVVVLPYTLQLEEALLGAGNDSRQKETATRDYLRDLPEEWGASVLAQEGKITIHPLFSRR